MTEMRPTSIFVIGLLNIVVGSIGVVWNGAGAVSLLAGDELARQYFTPAERAEMAALDQSIASGAPQLFYYRVVVMQLIPWLLTLWLLVGGVGLLKCRPWGRSVSILYAVVSILHKIGMAVYTFTYLLPIYKTPILILQFAKPQLAPGADIVANIANVATPLLLMTYPVLVLFVMFRPSVAVALSEPPEPVQAAA